MYISDEILKSYLQMQQTPKPDAQDPSLVPPLLEHSSLKFLNKPLKLNKNCL